MIGSFLSSIGGQMCNWCHYQKSFAYLSCKTTNWFHIAVGLYSSRSQKASKCCKHISDTLSCVLWATFFVLTIFCVGTGHTWQNKYNNNFYASRFLVFLYRIITMNDKWGSIWWRFEVIASYTALNPLLKLTQQKLQKKTAGNAQATHFVWETAPKVYCQRHYKLYVNAMNHTFWRHLWYITEQTHTT